MRKHHIVSVVVLILVGFAAKLMAPTAEADVRAGNGVSMDVSRLHENKNLSVQKIDDRSFVFSDAD
jgi:hypothetical protein